MGGRCDEAGAWPGEVGAAAGAQMQAGFLRRREMGIAGDDEGNVSGPAEFGDGAGQGRVLGLAEDDAAEICRQCGDGGERIGQALAVRKQPEDGQARFAPLLYRAGPA